MLAVHVRGVPDAPIQPEHRDQLIVGRRARPRSSIWVETRLRDAEVTDLLGALIGGAIGLGLAKTIGAALFWADTTDPRVVFLHSVILLVFPYLGHRHRRAARASGSSRRGWSALFRDAGPQRRYRFSTPA